MPKLNPRNTYSQSMYISFPILNDISLFCVLSINIVHLVMADSNLICLPFRDVIMVVEKKRGENLVL